MFQGNLRSWLLNPDGHDEFAVIYGDPRSSNNAAICYNTPQEPLPVCDRKV